MPEMLLRDIPDDMQDALRRRAEEAGQSPEDAARDILRQVLFQDRLTRILDERGLGAALHALGRELDVTGEFDNLRSREQPEAPDLP